MAQEIFSGNCCPSGTTADHVVDLAADVEHIPYTASGCSAREVSSTVCVEETGILTKNEVP